MPVAKRGPRYMVAVSDAENESLLTLADKNGRTPTATIRRALQFYIKLEQLRKEGYELGGFKKEKGEQIIRTFQLL